MRKPAKMVKRVLDLCIAIIAIPLVLIIAVLITIIIRLTSGPPALFRQERAGQNMRPFTLYKFRTMRTDIDPFGPSPKAGNDPRLTKIGRILRKYSLDELPQIWNVFIGNMSLVGPRPLYMDQAKQWNDRQKKRLLAKPGLTGLAQISGRASLTIEDKIELDVKYVEKQSLIFDAGIFITTFFKLFQPKDIYEKRYSKTQKTRKPE